MTDMWGDLVWAALADLKTRLMLVLPGILAMLTLAAVGLAGAWVSARVARRLAQAVAFDRRAEAWGIVAALNRAGVRKPPSQVLGLVVFWSVLVLFLPVAIDALAIPGTGRLTEFVFSWVPRVMGAALILLRRGSWPGPSGGACSSSRAPPPSPTWASARRWCWSRSGSPSAG